MYPSPKGLPMETPGPLTSPDVRTLLTDARLAGSWILDSSRSTVELKTRHTWGLRPLAGVFRQVSGQGTVSPAGEVSGTITVAAASVDTRHKKRDSDLRSGRLFDVSKYPEIVFAVDRISPGADAVTVEGKLTVRDQTRPLSFPVRVTLPGEHEVVLDGEAQVNRAEFGLTFNPLGMASMDNVIVVHAVLTRRTPAA
jgi:polyisoprenoid-binding protein YceI